MKSFAGQLVGLRALEPKDLDILYKWENNPTIWQLGQTMKPFSKDVLSKYLQTAHLDIFETRQIRFVIYKIKKHDVPLGFIDLFDFDPQHERAGIGILIGEEFERKKGFAKEALDLMCQYSFDILHLHQLYCTIDASNQPSISLFKRSGFVRTGERIDWIKTKKGWETEYFFQLSSQLWESKAM